MYLNCLLQVKVHAITDKYRHHIWPNSAHYLRSQDISILMITLAIILMWTSSRYELSWFERDKAFAVQSLSMEFIQRTPESKHWVWKPCSLGLYLPRILFSFHCSCHFPMMLGFRVNDLQLSESQYKCRTE